MVTLNLSHSDNVDKKSTKLSKLNKAKKLFEQILKEDGVEYNANQNTMNDPTAVYGFLYGSLSDKEKEQFICLFLNNQHKLIKCEVLFQGTVNQCSVYPREIIKTALQCNASALIISHNHPSGLITPSLADKNLTNRIKQACDLMEIKLLDHIIVGKGAYYSFAEELEL